MKPIKRLRHNVFVNGRKSNGKPLCNAAAVCEIVRQWVAIKGQPNVSLNTLRQVFPRALSHDYYEKRKSYKYIIYPKPSDPNHFYPNDGERLGQSLNPLKWDIADDGRYDINVNDGKVIILKHWFKDDTSRFFDYAKAFPEFQGQLIIQSF